MCTKRKLARWLGALGLAMSATIAHALPLNVPVPGNAYITKGGYDVAWAAPCAATAPSCGVIDLTYQSQFGWEIMTEELFNQLNISAYDFVVEGGNVDYFTGNNLDEVSNATLSNLDAPLPQGDLAIAVPYFSTVHLHADWGNGRDGVWDPISTSSIAEALVVRVADGAAVPEPSMLALLGIGLLGFRFARKGANG